MPVDLAASAHFQVCVLAVDSGGALHLRHKTFAAAFF